MADLDQSTSQASDDSSQLGPATPTVRFDSECILIPDTPTKSPIMLTKSYSLPLWRRRASSDASAVDPTSPDPAGSLIVRLPIPNFRGRPLPMPHDSKPLTSCIVHRDPTSPKPRRASLPKAVGSPKLHKDMTVPLRSCCEGCIHATEECVRVGEAWKVKFTSGAKRKMRRASMNDATSAVTFDKIKVDEVANAAKKKKHAVSASLDDASKADSDPSLFPLPSSPPYSPSNITTSEFPWTSGSAIADSPGEVGVLDNALPLGRKGHQPGYDVSIANLHHLDPISEANTPIVSRSTSPLPPGASQLENDQTDGTDAFASPPAPNTASAPAPLQGTALEGSTPALEADAPLSSSATTSSPPSDLAHPHSSSITSEDSTQISPVFGAHAPFPCAGYSANPPKGTPLVPSESPSWESSPEPEKYGPPTSPKAIAPTSPTKTKRPSFSGSIFRHGAGILKGVSSTMGGVSV